MSGNRIFGCALLISVAVHGIFFMQHYGFQISPANKEEKIEISYIKKPAEEKPKLKEAPPKTRHEPFLELKDKAAVKRRTPPPYVEKENPALKPRPQIGLKTEARKPLLTGVQVISVKNKVNLPAVMEADKIKDPSCVNYYQIVREKIKRAAFRSYNGRERGEVTLSFIISNQGSLEKIFLMEEYSAQSAYLREIAVNSVKDASPFPRFPKELDYPCLLFRLPIEFEAE